MRKVAVLSAVLLAVLAFWLLPRVWNPVEYGPDWRTPVHFSDAIRMTRISSLFHKEA